MSLADDVLAIANLKARYCATADSSATEPDAARAAFRTVFTPDVVADYGFGVLEGCEAAAEFMCSTVPGNSAWMLHMLHSPRIELDGDAATGEWTVMVHARRRAGDGVDVIVGRYADEFRRTGEGWRIARVRFAQLT